MGTATSDQKDGEQKSGDFNLERRVIVVTGGASGIGKIYSTRLAASGATVIAADLVHDLATQTAEEIRRAGKLQGSNWTFRTRRPV